MSDRTAKIVKEQQNGFSMLELLLVIAIIAIVAAVLIPTIASALPKYRLRSAVRQLVIDFKQARLEAIKSNRNTLIVFTPELVASAGGSYQLCVDTDSDGACGGSELLKTTAMPRDVLLYTTNFGGNDTGYSNQGLPLETGRVELRDSTDTHRYALVLSSAGGVRLESSSDGGVTWNAY